MKNVGALIVGIVAIVGITLLALLVGYPIKWTWNHVMPHIFDLPQIDFWQAFCLYWLSNALLRATQTNENKAS